jgi:hypothetical protein
MEYDCATRTVAGTTLVTVTVRNDAAVPRRVRVRNALPGPVLPPQREGVSERGWDDDGFAGVVPANDARSVGYACPVVSDAESPVAVESLGRVDGPDDADADPEAEAVRTLGRARPPADAVPTPDVAARAASDRPSDDASSQTDGRRTATDECAAPAEEPVSPESDPPSPRDGPARTGADPPNSPASVESWLSAVEARVRRAETLTDATAAEAAAVLESTACVAGLPAAVAADEAALRAFADRARTLADRAGRTDSEPVVEAVGSLAGGER